MEELNCTWYFGPESGADDGPNDALAENFNSRPTISLVRETIQNSLDAVIKNSKQPVKVEYSFGELTLEDVPNLCKIKEHIEGCLTLYSDNDNAKEYFPPMLDYIDNLDGKIPYIKVSDRNTTGMNYIDDMHTQEPFYAFVRSKGVTVKKSASSGGSFGFGKAAYFGMSKIKTVLVSTRTVENRAFFQGISSLCTHLTNNPDEGKRSAVGYYDNNSGLPIELDYKIPSTFLRDKDDFGTDFWIIGYDKNRKDLIKKDMIIAVLRSFWLSIKMNDLIVIIDGNEINAGNLYDIIKEYFPEENDKQTSTRENFNPRPYLEAILHADDGNPKFKKISKHLDILGDVTLYAYLTKQGSNKVMLTRKPKMLVQFKNVSPIGVCAVFNCDNEEGNKILKRMENPAHSLWLAGRKADTKDAYKELEKFLTDEIGKLRPVSGKKSLQIMGLSDLAWIPESLITDDVESDDDSEQRGTRLTNILTDDEGGNQVVLVKKIATKTVVKKIATVEEEEKDATDIPDDESDDMVNVGEEGTGGRTPVPPPTPPVPGPPPTPVPGPYPGPHPKPDIDGVESKPASKKNKKKITEVRFRQKAEFDHGHYVHILNIYPPRNIVKANVGLFVSWEDGYTKQPIKEACADGKKLDVQENKILGVSLSQSGTKISVCFYDNIKHAIKISVEDGSN